MTAERLRDARSRTAVDVDAAQAELGEYGPLIDGRQLHTGDAIEVHSPYDDALVAIVHCAGPQEIETAISSADRAFPETRRLPSWRRAEILQKISGGIAARHEEFSRTIAVVPCTTGNADLLVEDRRIKFLTFTVSPAVGWALKKRAGQKLVTLELGGNAGTIVYSEVNGTEHCSN